MALFSELRFSGVPPYLCTFVPEYHFAEKYVNFLLKSAFAATAAILLPFVTRYESTTFADWQQLQQNKLSSTRVRASES